MWRSTHGWFDEREACTKKLQRRWRHGLDTTISQNPGRAGGGGGGGLGGVAYKDRARPPPVIEAQPHNITNLTIKTAVRKIQKHDSQTGSCAWTRQRLDKGGGGGVALIGMCNDRALVH